MDCTDDQNRFGGIWTHIKLAALGKYLPAYIKALKNQSFQKIYIDAFAGTGRCEVKTSENQTATIEGSARIALRVEPPFDRYYFIELDPRKTEALQNLAKEFTDRSITIIQGNANEELQTLCKEINWKNTRGVLFLDPFGLKVKWETLKAIAKTQALDVWYLFSYSGLYRQAAKSSEKIDPDKEAAITEALGTDEWKEKFYVEQPQLSLFGAEPRIRTATCQELLDFFSECLKGIFASVLQPKILYLNNGSPIFALYFAVSNQSQRAIKPATNIADHILKGLQ